LAERSQKTQSFQGYFPSARASTTQVWEISGGLAVVDERPLRIEDLARRFESWLPDYMAGSS